MSAGKYQVNHLEKEPDGTFSLPKRWARFWRIVEHSYANRKHRVNAVCIKAYTEAVKLNNTTTQQVTVPAGRPRTFTVVPDEPK